MEQIKVEEVKVGDCRIHTLRAGEGGGRSIILLHGMKFRAETWRGLGTLEKLAENGFNAIAVDMPGFGLSEACDMSPRVILHNLIAQEKLDQPLLIGPSMGGRICLEYTLQHPEMVGGLILVGPVGVKENQDRLHEIKQSCQLIWGGEDTISPIDNGHVLEREITGSRLSVIEGAPHPCYLDHTEEFHGIILDFLKGF
ncbi:alpha/beta fold hydrolase [Thermodesulfobacteriota bacterium]